MIPTSTNLDKQFSKYMRFKLLEILLFKFTKILLMVHNFNVALKEAVLAVVALSSVAVSHQKVSKS